MDFDTARLNMVNQQIRTWDVDNLRVIEAFNDIPRELFTPSEFHDVAYADTDIPINDSSSMLPPKTIARILQALHIEPHEKVLEIGTGTGYCTALLAKLAKHVTTVELDPALSKKAATNIEKLKIHNVTFEVGNAAAGWEGKKPFDVIVITGGLPFLPPEFKKDLAVGGRLSAFLGNRFLMEVVLVTRTSNSEYTSTTLFETVAKELCDAPHASHFKF